MLVIAIILFVAVSVKAQTDDVQLVTLPVTPFAHLIQVESYITTSSESARSAIVTYSFDPDITIDSVVYGDPNGYFPGDCTIDSGSVVCPYDKVSSSSDWYIRLTGHISDCHKGAYTFTSTATIGMATDTDSDTFDIQNPRVCTYVPFIQTELGGDHWLQQHTSK